MDGRWGASKGGLAREKGGVGWDRLWPLLVLRARFFARTWRTVKSPPQLWQKNGHAAGRLYTRGDGMAEGQALTSP